MSRVHPSPQDPLLPSEERALLALGLCVLRVDRQVLAFCPGLLWSENVLPIDSAFQEHPTTTVWCPPSPIESVCFQPSYGEIPRQNLP